MKFFTNVTVLIVLLRSFYTIYVEISVHLIVPLRLQLFFGSSRYFKISEYFEKELPLPNWIKFITMHSQVWLLGHMSAATSPPSQDKPLLLVGLAQVV